jgi:hypothetical protein
MQRWIGVRWELDRAEARHPGVEENGREEEEDPRRVLGGRWVIGEGGVESRLYAGLAAQERARDPAHETPKADRKCGGLHSEADICHSGNP